MSRVARVRHIAWAVFLLSLLATLAGCNFPEQAQHSDIAKDQTLKLIWAQSGNESMLAFDPVRVQEDGGRQVASLLFDGLVTLDRNEHIEPWGATSWTISRDGLTYTFNLRPNQRFSDGTRVTASDYAWSIDRAMNPCAGSYIYFDLAVIKDSGALTEQDCLGNPSQTAEVTLVGRSILPEDNANTLTILLAQPAGYFLSVLASSAGVALERSILRNRAVYSLNADADTAFPPALVTGETGQGGSGMFYLAHWTPAAYNNPGSLELKPNPHWWGIQAGKKPHFSEIDITVPLSSLYSAPNTGLDLFSNDPTQAFANALPTNLPITQFNRQPYYHEQPVLSIRVLIFYWRNAPFDDINARKAFCLAINREQFNQQVYHGQGMPTWHIIPQGMEGYNDHLKGLDSAPVTGDTVLAEHYWQLYLAAHHNQVPRILINYTLQGKPDFLEGSTWLKSAWNQTLDIQTQPDLSEWGHGPGWAISRQIVGYIAGAVYADPQYLLSLFSQLNAGSSPNITVPAADALMRQADALPDLSQRLPLYQQAEQLLIDSVAVCPLAQYVNHYALRPWVKGDFIENARGLFPNDAWVTGYIAKH
jgi:oligopeptide transport system substrate-binding protein